MSGAERGKLDELFARQPHVGMGWRAVQELRGLYRADGALEHFRDLYLTGEVPEFHDVDDTVIARSTEILDFDGPCAGRIRNGRMEGTNNKLQVFRRVAHGFTNRANFVAPGRSPVRLCDDLGDRIQRSPHEFTQAPPPRTRCRS